MTDARVCFAILETQQDDHGYIPSLVTENEAGHAPMTGRGDDAVPWYWGKTRERAQQVCDRVNLDRYGISPKTACRIIASSMHAGNVIKKRFFNAVEEQHAHDTGADISDGASDDEK